MSASVKNRTGQRAGPPVGQIGPARVVARARAEMEELRARLRELEEAAP